MPQINQLPEIYASQIFWLLLVFGLIYFGIGRGMVSKIGATIEARDGKIADDLAAATRARETADATEEAYHLRMDAARIAAQEATRIAKAEAASASEARVKAADVQLAAKADEAQGRLRAQQDEALAHIEEVAAEATQEIVARISGIAIDRAEATTAVQAALARA